MGRVWKKISLEGGGIPGDDDINNKKSQDRKFGIISIYDGIIITSRP